MIATLQHPTSASIGQIGTDAEPNATPDDLLLPPLAPFVQLRFREGTTGEMCIYLTHAEAESLANSLHTAVTERGLHRAQLPGPFYPPPQGDHPIEHEQALLFNDDDTLPIF